MVDRLLERRLLGVVVEGGSLRVDHQVEPAVGEITADLPQMDLAVVSAAMKQLAFAVSLDHGLVGLAVLDDRGLWVRRINAEADGDGVAVEDLLSIGIYESQFQIEIPFLVELFVEGLGQNERIEVIMTTEEVERELVG